MRKRVFGLIILCLGLYSCNDSKTTANYQVVPLPMEITETGDEAFQLNSNTQIVHDGSPQMKRNAEFLAEFIKEKTSRELEVTTTATGKAITLATEEGGEKSEAYRLTANANGITLTGATPAGVFYGVQTLRKAIPFSNGKSVTMPAVIINDAPRFSYRGAHLDVSRH
ncbi:MAG: beta-N-acetylhexosaminidase, partial [Bacteroidaceae bacterium]|nr:beta-N-acetylhexosaminidase [Bacteroidaceae bacterium]